ncbi:hypothetical protein QFC21_002249 [Naganishia friedmannii]|uniref:Uncharacterized protein n=1 Tax=Naganishia friedmannii TaxID=89922 RepID=A0ACC2VZH8_9TREE|nr:hypothetical protein QFC21_002249 [Naganishia friedmannii]
MFQLLASQVEPEELRQWIWEDGAKADVAGGGGKVLVVEKPDSKEVIGVAWFTTYTPNNPPRVPPVYPRGYNVVEAEKIIIPRVAWLINVVETYGGKRMHLQEIFIAKGYHGVGIGKQLMAVIINEAKESGCNMTLTAGPGVEGFYVKCGFKDIGEPYVLPDGAVRGIQTQAEMGISGDADL